MSSGKRPFDWQWAITTLLAAGILGSMMWMIHRESGGLAAREQSAERRMARIEAALHILASAQGAATRQQVNIALGEAQNSADSGMDMLSNVRAYAAEGKIAEAAASAENARTLLLGARELRTPVPPEYFSGALEQLDRLATIADPGVRQSLFEVRIALAEYRTALEPAPEMPARRAMLDLRPDQPIDPDLLRGRAVYSPTAQVTLPESMRLEARGAVIDGSQLPPGTEFLRPAGFSSSGSGSTVSGLTFDGLTQTLDGMKWQDVVFANARVRYRGGPLQLERVRFVNCTFEVTRTPRGRLFANGVALGRQTIEIP